MARHDCKGWATSSHHVKQSWSRFIKAYGTKRSSATTTPSWMRRRLHRLPVAPLWAIKGPVNRAGFVGGSELLRRWSDGKQEDDEHELFTRGARTAPFGWFSGASRRIIPRGGRRFLRLQRRSAARRSRSTEWVEEGRARPAACVAALPTEISERLKALERENRELRQANEILRKASAYFAQAELDRRFKP